VGYAVLIDVSTGQDTFLIRLHETAESFEDDEPDRTDIKNLYKHRERYVNNNFGQRFPYFKPQPPAYNCPRSPLCLLEGLEQARNSIKIKRSTQSIVILVRVHINRADECLASPPRCLDVQRSTPYSEDRCLDADVTRQLCTGGIDGLVRPWSIDYTL
jgi:hypothetical protein